MFFFLFCTTQTGRPNKNFARTPHKTFQEEVDSKSLQNGNANQISRTPVCRVRFISRDVCVFPTRGAVGERMRKEPCFQRRPVVSAEQFNTLTQENTQTATFNPTRLCCASPGTWLRGQQCVRVGGDLPIPPYLFYSTWWCTTVSCSESGGGQQHL